MPIHFDRLIDVAGVSYNIVVGTTAQVTSGKATNEIGDFAVAISNNDRILILNGTHTLEQTETITETDLDIVFEMGAVIAKASTYTMTFSGVRVTVKSGRFSGFATGNITFSGADARIHILQGSALEVIVTGDRSIISPYSSLFSDRYDIVVGSTAQVTAGDAMHDVDTFVAAISNGDQIKFLAGTHTLGQSETITEIDLDVWFEPAAIIDNGTNYTLTFSGARCHIHSGQYIGFADGDIIVSGAGSHIDIKDTDIETLDLGDGVSGSATGVSGGLIYTRCQPIVLADDNVTLTLKHINRDLFQTPTSTDKTIDLPTTDVKKGDRVNLINLSTTIKMSIEASGGSVLMAFQDGHVRLMAKQDAPTTPAHWQIIEGSGGARPVFKAIRNVGSGDQTNITGDDVLEFDAEDYDNNGNYNITTYRWTPTVPGIYHVLLQTGLVGAVVGDQIFLRIYKNAGTLSKIETKSQDATLEMFSAFLAVEMNGTTDYFEAHAQITERDTVSMAVEATDSFFVGSIQAN